MSANGWLQLVLILGGLIAVTKPLGIYLVRVLDPEHEGPTFLDGVLGPIERFIYRVIGVDKWSDEEGFEEAAKATGVTGICGSAIIEVVAQYPGASAEEVERQVTIPLEVALAGMPNLETTRSKSLFGLSHIRNQFDYSRDYDQAKQDVINRIASANLPPGVNPQISPASPVGEIIRYTLTSPIDPATGKPVYTLSDLKAVQDYVVQRELLRVDLVQP